MLLVVCLLIAECSSYNAKPFDERVWLKSGVRGRGRMADDLVNRQLFRGKTKEELLTRLGKPDSIYDGVFHYQVAHIPRCTWFWDCAVLVYFDQGGKVSGTVITD